MSGKILKSIQPTKDDMELINRYARRTLTEDEVYTFSVILCDNDIDRDYERFTNETLLQLKNLFQGKTGIFDHNPKGENQTARIYDVSFVSDSNRVNQLGQPYCYLKAKAYMVKSEKNKSLILEIDAGIKKEVSIACSVDKISCSICGADQKKSACGHQKGKAYHNQICHYLLEDAKDAYEWSFVAVPAQVNAGVTKAYNAKEGFQMRNTETILKALNHCEEEITLTKQEAAALFQYLQDIEQKATLGEEYRNSLIKEVKRLSFLTKQHLEPQILESVANKMNINELKAFIHCYEQALQDEPQVQLSQSTASSHANENFKL